MTALQLLSLRTADATKAQAGDAPALQFCPLQNKTAAEIALRRGNEPDKFLLRGTFGSYTTMMLVTALQLVSPAAPMALTCTM